jgi:predicted signal transduction protein with EAL and GGDEF domain
VHFAREIGCELVAEGIETQGELRAVRELGVRFAQGYLLARPAPAATFKRRTEAPTNGDRATLARPAAVGSRPSRDRRKSSATLGPGQA